MLEIPMKIHFLLLLPFLIFFIIFSPSTQNPEDQESLYCGNIKTREHFHSPISNLTCRSGKLYFKTSIGLIHVSSIDYAAKTLTLSHSSGTEEVKLGLRARVSMEVEGHVPDLCSACERPDGNCGVARRCLCHPKECKDKVVSFGSKSRVLSGNTQLVPLFLYLALFLICV